MKIVSYQLQLHWVFTLLLGTLYIDLHLLTKSHSNSKSQDTVHYDTLVCSHHSHEEYFMQSLFLISTVLEQRISRSRLCTITFNAHLLDLFF